MKHYYEKPVYITHGKGQYLWDHNNRKYLDLIAGICTVSIGHSHPKVTEAIKKQASKLIHTTHIYMSQPIVEFTEKLLSKFPKQLDRVIFVNSGSEANDLAMLLARVHTQNWEIVCLRNAYHGASPYVVGATALANYKPKSPTGFGFLHLPNPDPYKGAWGGSSCRDSLVQIRNRTCSCTSSSECSAGRKYVHQLKEIYTSCARSSPAAFLTESVQGLGGTVQYPRNFLTEAFALTRSLNGLCISDEVQTGFGRMGSHFWGFESHGVVPDIVTVAKGIGNGFPLAAVVTNSTIADSFRHDHFNTFGGSPLACAVGSVVLEVIEEERLQENCERMGSQLILGLAELQQMYPDIIGDVRGKGLMLGIEMIEPPLKDSDLPTPMQTENMNQFFEGFREKGILIGKGGHYGNVFRIKPPMVINQKDVDLTLTVFQQLLEEYHRARNG